MAPNTLVYYWPDAHARGLVTRDDLARDVRRAQRLSEPARLRTQSDSRSAYMGLLTQPGVTLARVLCAVGAGFVELEAMDEVVVASLRAFCERGGGTLPYPGADVPALELWYAANRGGSAREVQGGWLRGAWASLTRPTAWKGRYSKQVPRPH